MWGEDWLAAVGVFILVVAASVSATLPFIFIDESWTALGMSNGILLAMFFIIGWQWAGYTSVPQWWTVTALTLFGVAIVAAAIALGG